jgi:hypothetical protein
LLEQWRSIEAFKNHEKFPEEGRDSGEGLSVAMTLSTHAGIRAAFGLDAENLGSVMFYRPDARRRRVTERSKSFSQARRLGHRDHDLQARSVAPPDKP